MKNLNHKATVWHNTACSTSRKGLEFIRENFEEVAIRNYIAEPPSTAELEAVLKKLNLPATAILRKKDKVFKELYEGKEMSNAAWIKAMHEHPSIIERPIVLIGDRVFFGRPYEDFTEQVKSSFF